MRLNEGQPLVMIGDSITVCERKYPYGEAIGFDWSRMRMGS
ncbi:hypothetical protein [Paenibacillus lautus]|nr:hypothetical protein [Paenibacillus lautus]